MFAWIEGEITVFKWTDHAEKNLRERRIKRDLVEETLKQPDEVVPGKKGRIIYHKLVGDKLLRVVVVENDLIITVYLTRKIQKYWRGGRR